MSKINSKLWSLNPPSSLPPSCTAIVSDHLVVREYYVTYYQTLVPDGISVG